MLYRFLFFLTFFLNIAYSFSQEVIDVTDLVLDDNEILNEDFYFIEMNNLGDPLLSLIPNFHNTDLSLSHYSQKYRKASYRKAYLQFETDSIYSHIIYQSSYSSGGLLNTFLTRPIGKFLQFNFSYDHLNSEGFYGNQVNNYSSLYVSLNYFNNKKPYYYKFLFFSNNGEYHHNGGVLYDSLLSLDVMNTYLNSSQTRIKNRVIDLQHYYLIKPNLLLKYTILFNFFHRDYHDQAPSSFHYSLTPLLYSIDDDSGYSVNNFCSRLLNSISLSNNNFIFELNHNYYNTDNIVINKTGDLDLVFSNTISLKERKNIHFKMIFCPFGYNQNNYIFDVGFYIKKANLTHDFSFLIKSKRPDFFTEHYNTSYSFDWHNFSPIRNMSFMWSSSLSKLKISLSGSVHHYRNYLYFNELVSPVQSEEDIIYYNLVFKKKWILNNIYINSDFVLQKSNNEIMSLPSLSFKQRIQYDYHLSDNINLLSSIDFLIFSKYYISSYFPLTDLFYLQLEQKRGLIPLLSADILLSKKQFSIGFEFNNLSTFFFEGESLISNYPFAPPTLQFLMKWQFLN